MPCAARCTHRPPTRGCDNLFRVGCCRPAVSPRPGRSVLAARSPGAPPSPPQRPRRSPTAAVVRALSRAPVVHVLARPQATTRLLETRSTRPPAASLFQPCNLVAPLSRSTPHPTHKLAPVSGVPSCRRAQQRSTAREAAWRRPRLSALSTRHVRSAPPRPPVRRLAASPHWPLVGPSRPRALRMRPSRRPEPTSSPSSR
jgi:hypothetical protein